MTLDDVGPGSLKLIVATNDEDLEFVLGEWFNNDQRRRLSPGVWMTFGHYDVATLRDNIRERMDDGIVFVAEFEHWAGYGDIDQEWLLRRGH